MDSVDAEPSARFSPFTTSAGDCTYLWGGSGDAEPEAVFVYHHDAETWTRWVTSGPHPPAGLKCGGCAMSGHNLYLYGGYDNNNCNCGDLYKLDTQTWQWTKLCDGSAGGPGKKYWCKMISYQDKLLVVGGIYDEMPSSGQAGASYVKKGSAVHTNEVHGYSLTSGSWFSPRVKGSRPPPCPSFSLTMTDKDHAILGGYNLSGMFKAWTLHLPTMWSRPKEVVHPWPGKRSFHIAACLDYGGQHQRLLISGGCDDDSTHDDMWLMDPQSDRMEEVDVPKKDKKLIQRFGHGAAAVTVITDCVEVILFGGQKNREGSFIADPVVLRFEFQKTSPNDDHWSLTDIADSTQLGSPARLELQLQECQAREDELQARAEELQTQVNVANRRAEDSNGRARRLQTQVIDANRRAEASNGRARRLQTQMIDANRRAETSNERAERLRTQVQGAEDRLQGLQRSLARTMRQGEDLLQANSTHWVVRREEIELTQSQLGVGGWATVTVAKFRGIQVAVKRIHDEIISHHNRELFQREMNMAARLRHPNLIQFIGATMEGEMMIVMELMATSLRSQLKSEEYFPPKVVKAISLDVARGLNYLHLVQPDPIVHRDISSANVLLEQLPLNQWRAKLTDYGSVNVLRQLRTVNPGSPAYAAPEASSNPHLQSPKMGRLQFWSVSSGDVNWSTTSTR